MARTAKRDISYLIELEYCGDNIDLDTGIKFLPLLFFKLNYISFSISKLCFQSH